MSWKRKSAFNKSIQNPRLRGFFILGLLLLYGISLPSQNMRDLGPAEWKWVLFHPIAAVKVFSHRQEIKQCLKKHENHPLLDSFPSGGKQDAFRHCFTMAYLTQFVSAKKLQKLGIAHEKTNHRQFKKGKLEDGELPDSLSSVMDIYNNTVGLHFFDSLFTTTLSPDSLAKEIIQDIQKGKCIFFKRNAWGKWVDCQGNEIPTPEKKCWFIPKCLWNGFTHF